MPVHQHRLAGLLLPDLLCGGQIAEGAALRRRLSSFAVGLASLSDFSAPAQTPYVVDGVRVAAAGAEDPGDVVVDDR